MKRKTLACAVIFGSLFSGAWMTDIYLKNMPYAYQLNVYQQSNVQILHNFNNQDFEVQSRQSQQREEPFKPREYIRKQQIN